MDFSRQFQQSLVAVSENANKCNDRINHIIMSLLLLAIEGGGRINKSNAIVHSRDAILPTNGTQRFKHVHGGSTRLQPIARIMSRQRSSPSMLANAELSNDEGL
jgi:hypothetical protein